MLPLSLFAYDGTGCAGMQEEFLTSVAQIKKKLRLDMDPASMRLTARVSRVGRRTYGDNCPYTIAVSYSSVTVPFA